MAKVEINFPSEEHAQAFLSWMDNSGEQDFDENNWVTDESLRLGWTYDYTNRVVIARKINR